jgi:fission process protein 1
MDSHNRGHDIYKDTPIRLLGNFIESFRYSLVNLVCGTGYANEVGESLRGFIGAKWVNISYGIATLYVFADTIDKTAKTYHRNSGKSGRIPKTLYIATDTLIWQMLASVVIPGFVINRVCYFSNYVLYNTTKLPPNNRKLIVTCIGLGIIPFIIKPIDRSVDTLLDYSLRKIAP